MSPQWDFLVDVQLWSSAALAQVVAALIPFGWIWDPVLDDLVNVVHWVESEYIREVSYYRQISNFINALLEQNYTSGDKSFHTLRVTGE